MSCTVGKLYELLCKMAPPELAEEWDNIGLLAGRMDARVDTALCALDLNPAVLREAVNKGAQLIVTHHPILFRGRKNLREDDAEGRLLCDLVRSNIAMIAMHTNYDNACPGVNDALAAALGLENVQIVARILRVGEVEAMPFERFADAAEVRLGGPIRRYGEARRSVRRIAVVGGSGGDYLGAAISAGAEVFLTGEISYHRATDAADNGLMVLEAGHAATELPGIYALSKGLQMAADAVQYDIRVLDSNAGLFL